MTDTPRRSPGADMTARGDYQYGERGSQFYTMCDEIDQLRAERDALRNALAVAVEGLTSLGVPTGCTPTGAT